MTVSKLFPQPLRLASALLAAVALAASPAQEPSAPGADPSAGQVLDREGTCLRRPALAERWGPADAHTRLEPGDWLECGTRGANALRLSLASGAELVLGPGALVEVVDGTRVRLHRGELEVSAGASAALVLGPNEATVGVQDRAVLRAQGGSLVRLAADPRWLVGYRSDASTEKLGSLLANVDGRNVPLTIGYHKVTVDIRDQIARTVIEESFVNHTSSVLEGVFVFPLPDDASVSSFGMWIGDELVQGEIVEKQRAREIYETILRERRDPGLLEWSGGNLFKARIFPIGAEKRIRIAYTQVLPKRADGFAYHYALQSDMLRRNPLRRIELSVHVASTDAIASVASPTHSCRVQASEHAARVEFTAEDYTPESDFELRIRTTPAEPGEVGLTLVPHRRGDDGYFMLLVDTPEAAAAADAPSDPINLLVLADTSGSMEGPPRAAQIAFVEALLTALGPRDSFQVATCDAQVRWAFRQSAQSSPRAREEALDFLERREPLGWSDLETAFAQAFERAGPATHVVYVGDGIPTSGAADPTSVVERLERAHRERGGQATCHAVVPGNRSEPRVLRALSRLGAGSLRTIRGSADPARSALALLEEIAAPAVKNLEIAFEGLDVAAVHPEPLTNLVAGRQRIVVGRFDPAAAGGTGRVTLSGTFAGEPLLRTVEVDLDADESGNSFVPRLWARNHLDHLLSQGSSPAVRERVIALSEDFQIITPYTSFLVLESDEDRERFQVEKSLRMRDGEEFFAAGREEASHELLREQMQRAQSWRRRLRAEALAALARMDRGLTELLRSGAVAVDARVAFGDVFQGGFGGSGARNAPLGAQHAARDQQGFDGDESFYEESGAKERFGEADDAEGWEAEPALVEEELKSPAESLMRQEKRVARKSAPASRAPGFLASRADHFSGRGRMNSLGYVGGSYYHDPFDALFPGLGGPRIPDPEWSWSEDIVAALQGLDRRRAIAASEIGWSVVIESRFFGARGREQTSRGRHLLGPESWLVESAHAPGYQYSIDWLDGEQRGSLRSGWWLGRVRAKTEGDERGWQAPFSWYFGDQVRAYASHDARAERDADGRVRIAFEHSSRPNQILTLVIDTERGVLLEQTWSLDGNVTSRISYDEFHEVGGSWWPARAITVNKFGRVSTSTAIHVEPLESAKLAERIAATLEVRERAIVLTERPDQTLETTKQAVLEERGSLDDHWALLRHFAATQRFDRAEPHLVEFLVRVESRPGTLPIRCAWLRADRRLEELRERLMVAARDFAGAPRDGEYTLATELLGYGSSLNAGNERLALLEVLQPLFARQESVLDPLLAWDRMVVQALDAMGRAERAFAERARMARAYPHAVDLHGAYANALAQRGEVDAALDWLATAEAEHGPWQEYELSQLRRSTAYILWNGYRLESFVATLEAWEREEESRLDAGLLNQLLSALIFLDREAEAWDRITTWLASSERDERSTLEQNRLQAAVQHALGQGYDLYSSRYDDERAELLATVARALAFRESDEMLAGQILQHYQFRQTDAALAVLTELYDRLDSDLLRLSAGDVRRWTLWLRAAAYAPDGGERGEEGWQELFDRVFARWLAAPKGGERDELAQVLLVNARPELLVRLRRHVYQNAEAGAERRAARKALFDTLLQQTWTAAVEDEVAALLQELGEDPDPELGIRRAIVALYDFASWLSDARASATVAALPDVNLLSRRALATARTTALDEARTAAAARLASLEAALLPAELQPWARVERTYLLVKTRSGLREARESSLAILTALAERHGAGDAELLLRDQVLAARCASTYGYLLARYTAELREEHEPAFGALVDAAIESGSELLDWRATKVSLLLALDRASALEELLDRWYDSDDVAALRWGRDRAYLAAERGDLGRAAAVMEDIEARDELGHEDLRALADWYTALDRKDAARGARIRSWEVLGENAIANSLSQESHRVQRRGDGVPEELDPEVPLRFVALLRKSASPANWYWLLRSYYEPTKDFRLLECLPEAILGQSAQRVYPFLNQIGALGDLIQEEATVDRLRAHLTGLFEGSESDTDRRALAMLEFVMVRRAAAQTQGAEEHARVALEALQRASKGTWERGEPRLMAELLAAQGALVPEALASEQLRQLRELQGLESDSEDRFAIADSLATTLWAQGQREPAVRTLDAALDRSRAEHDGRLPASVRNPLERLSGWMSRLGEFRAAEELWLAELGVGHPRERELWTSLELDELYRDAVLARASVSLGEGRPLYQRVRDRILGELDERTNEQHTAGLTRILCDLWTRAHRELRYSEIAPDAVTFAFTRLPRALDRYQYRGGQDQVRVVAECLVEVGGVRPALEFLTTRAENEPRWIRLKNRDFWSRHAWRFAELRHQLGPTGTPLDARVLALVLRELREDLRTRVARGRSMYDVRHQHFWGEQQLVFRRVALELLDENLTSDRSVTYGADYLYHGLSYAGDAIDLLERCYRLESLGVDGRAQLARYLQEQRRWSESIPYVVELIEDRPREADYRAMLMRAHHRLGDAAALASAHAAAEADLRELDVWQEHVIAVLAAACLDTELFAECASHYDEAIALHVRGSSNRGVGDGVLSTYYRNQAGAYSGLGQVDEAVDAAAGAIVSWGHGMHQRQQELVRLEEVLAAAADLDGFVARLDARTAKEGIELPIVRKALGKVYLAKGRHETAALQLLRALDAEPNDEETHQLLVASYDGSGRADRAADAVLAWARAAGNEPRVLIDLGRRYTQMERTESAERAFTTLVETLPDDSEGHVALAQVREGQGRFDDAARAWRHVVRIRTGEPTGYLGLARALMRMEAWEEARAVVDQLLRSDWPEHFGDVEQAAMALLHEIRRSS